MKKSIHEVIADAIDYTWPDEARSSDDLTALVIRAIGDAGFVICSTNGPHICDGEFFWCNHCEREQRAASDE